MNVMKSVSMSRGRGLLRSAMMMAMVAGGAIALSGDAAMAQGKAGEAPAAKGAAPAARETIVSLELAGMDQILIDPKDAALRRALMMVPSRLAELPDELPDGEEAKDLFTLLRELYARPARIIVQYRMPDQKVSAESPFGVGVLLSFGMADKPSADRAQAAVNALLEQAPMPEDPQPSKAAPSMLELETPGGLVRWGPRNSGAQWRYEVQLGSLNGTADAVFPAMTPVKSSFGEIQPYMVARGDLAPLTPLIGMLGGIAAGDPTVANALRNAQDAGQIGEEAVRYEVTSGHANDRTVTQTRIVGLKPYAGAGGYSLTPLSADDLRLIPGDAQVATMTAMDPTPFFKMIEQAVNAAPEGRQFLKEFTAQTGVDPLTDILPAFGNVTGMYMADATGGGGLTSLVVANKLKDVRKLRASMGKLATFANGFLGSPQTAQGYVQFRAWSVEGVEYTSLQFPGVPVPLELTYTILEGANGSWLLTALNPQAAVAAVRQATGKGDAGIMGNEAFASQLPKGLAEKMVSVNFADTRVLLREGYPLMTFASASLSNLVRSRRPGGDREPGLVLPTYNELARGVRPVVQVGFWDGNDFVTEMSSDRSILVNLGASAGAISRFTPLLAGVAVPAVIRAAEAARVIEPPGAARRRPGF
jgi:hypothetical protein